MDPCSYCHGSGFFNDPDGGVKLCFCDAGIEVLEKLDPRCPHLIRKRLCATCCGLIPLNSVVQIETKDTVLGNCVLPAIVLYYDCDPEPHYEVRVLTPEDPCVLFWSVKPSEIKEVLFTASTSR